MNKAGLIEKLAETIPGINKKQAEMMLDSVVDTIISELKSGRKVNIVGFGSFEAKTRHARGGINPQNPTQRIRIPQVTVAKFKTGKTLKDALKHKDLQEEAAAVTTEPAAVPTTPESTITE